MGTFDLKNVAKNQIPQPQIGIGLSFPWSRDDGLGFEVHKKLSYNDAKIPTISQILLLIFLLSLDCPRCKSDFLEEVKSYSEGLPVSDPSKKRPGALGRTWGTSTPKLKYKI